MKKEGGGGGGGGLLGGGGGGGGGCCLIGKLSKKRKTEKGEVPGVNGERYGTERLRLRGGKYTHLYTELHECDGKIRGTASEIVLAWEIILAWGQPRSLFERSCRKNRRLAGRGKKAEEKGRTNREYRGWI